MRPDVSIVIACYNEEGHLEQSIAELLEVMDATRWNYELIFVEDCGTDNTRAVIEAIINTHPNHSMRAIFHETNTGRGRAVTDGLQAAAAPVAGFIDIDLEVHARYIPTFVLAIQKGADLVTADREYRIHWGLLHRHILSRGYSWLVQTVLRLPYRDTEAGYKFFNMAKVLPVLDEVEDQRWFWDTEIIARCHFKNFAIAEIPCLFIRRGDKKSTLRVVHDTLEYVGRLYRFRKQMNLQRTQDHVTVNADR